MNYDTYRSNDKKTLLSTVSSVVALLFSFVLLCIGHGFLNTVLGVRAAVEGFSSFYVGLIGFAYFGGFIFGIALCSRLIVLVGHIRTFAALGSIVSALSISFLLSVNIFSWILFRFLFGVCIAALYMVIESWLNSLSSQEDRARILSIYMILIYLSFAFSQFLLNISQLDSFLQFVLVSILLSISIVPLCVSSKAKPAELFSEPLDFAILLKKVPYGSSCCFFGGMVVGILWSMMPAYLEFKKVEASSISIYIAMIYFGALALQYPLGRLSDMTINRRTVLKLVSLVGAGVFLLTILCINKACSAYIVMMMFFFIGGLSFPMYSLSLAHIIDHLNTKYIVSASGSLILLNALGAMVGTLFCSLLMSFIGVDYILYFCAFVFLLNYVLSFVFTAAGQPENAGTTFMAVPRTTLQIHNLDPRIPLDNEMNNPNG